MPQALAAIIVAAVGITGTAATIATAVIAIGISAGLTALVRAVMGTPSAPKPSDVQRITRVNVGSRVRHYGIVHTGGQLTFEEAKHGTATFVAGKTTGALFQVITTGHGELDSILEHRLNNVPVTVSGGVVTDFQYRNMVRIYSRLGAADQTAISELTAQFAEWTSNHRQRGCSHVALFFATPESKYFSDVYAGNTAPVYSQVVKGARVYDPRLDTTAGGSGSHRLNDATTWEWSDNAALVWADYLGHPDGFGLGYENINWQNIAEEADVCDETVTTVDARTIPRWRICGSYRLADDERRTVLQEMRKACDGFIWQDANGLANIRVGRWMEPTVTLTDDHIIGVTGSLGGDPQERTNEVRIIYSDPDFDYGEQEAAPQIDLVAQAAVGRDEASRFDIFYCPDHNQASRLGKRLLRQVSAEWNLTVVANLYALNLIGERFCLLTINELGITDQPFEILTFRLDGQSNLVELTVQSCTEDDFLFNAAAEEGDPPLLPGETAPTITLAAPTGLALEPIIVSGGGVAIKATWDEGPIGVLYEAQYEPTAGGTILALAVDQDGRVGTTGPVIAGTDLTVRVRAITPYGRASAWAEEEITPPEAESLAKQFRLVASALVVERNFQGAVNPTQVVTFTGYKTNTAAPIIARLYRSNADGTVTQLDAGTYLDGSGTITDNSPDALSFSQTGDEITITGENYELALSAGIGLIIEGVCDGITDRAALALVQGGAPVEVLLDAFLSPAAVTLTVNKAGVVSSYAAAVGTFVIETIEGVDISSNFTLSTASNPQALTINYTGMGFAITAGLDDGESSAEVAILATGSGDYADFLIQRTFVLGKRYGELAVQLVANANERNALTPDAPVITAGPSLSSSFASGNVSVGLTFTHPVSADPDHKNSVDYLEFGYWIADNSTPYTFGTDPANEIWVSAFTQMVSPFSPNILADKSADVWYTFAVRMVRQVHSDISADSAIRGALAQTVTPYRPADDGAYAPPVRRNGDALSACTFAVNGSAMEHNLRNLGFADIRAVWSYAGSTALISGFEVLVFAATGSAAYTPETFPTLEDRWEVSPTTNAIVLPGVAGDLYWTVAVRPFREVDTDINATGRIYGAWAKPTLAAENPYRPSASVSIASSVLIDGTSAANVSLWSGYANSAINADGTIKDDKVITASVADQALVAAGYVVQGGTIFLADNETWATAINSTSVTLRGARAVLDMQFNFAIGMTDPNELDEFSIAIRGFIERVSDSVRTYSDAWTETFIWQATDATGAYYSPRKTATMQFVFTGHTPDVAYNYGFEVDCATTTNAALYPYRYGKLNDLRATE